MSSKAQLGWVYVLQNASFKANMIKIGFTNKPTPQERALELSKHTGVPTEFEVVYAVQVPHAQDLETRVHQILQSKRARNNREFFECSPDEAAKTIRSAAGRSIVKEMDLRGTAFRQPESAKKSNSRNKKIPPNKHKNRGLIFTMMILLILFFLAMLFVGWNVEQKEQQNATPQPEKSTTPAKSSRPNPPQPVVESDDDVQAAWHQIPPEIRETLQEEQQEWTRQKQSRCAKMQDKAACKRELNAARVRYLRGFSI